MKFLETSLSVVMSDQYPEIIARAEKIRQIGVAFFSGGGQEQKIVKNVQHGCGSKLCKDTHCNEVQKPSMALHLSFQY